MPGRRPQRRRPLRGPGLVGRRRLAGLQPPGDGAAPRDQAVRSRQRPLLADHAAGVPRLQPQLRPAGPRAVLPVAAHLRPGVRQRAVRDELPARRASLPGGAARRRAGALRARAATAEGRGQGRRSGRGHGRRDAAARRPGGTLAAHRGLPRARGALRPAGRRGARQGGVERAADRGPAGPRRPQGTHRPARGLRLRDAAHRHADGQGRRLCARRRPPDAAGARRQALARDRRRPPRGPARGSQRRAFAQERLADLSRIRVSVDPRAEWRQMLCECGGCSATASVADMSGVDWPRCWRATSLAAARGHARRAVRPDLGVAGRARHLARLRVRRRPPQAAAGRAGPAGRRAAAGARRRELGDRAHRAGRQLGRERRFAAARSGRRGAGGRAHRRRQRPAGVAHASAAGPAGQPGRLQGGADAGRRRPAAPRGAHDAGRRGAGALPRVGGAQPRVGACAVAGARRLPAPAGHDGRRLRRVPPLLRHRMRPRGADRRPALQPRRPRQRAAAGKVARKRIGVNVSRWGRTVPYPEESAAGPVVALCNEHAGSDATSSRTASS